MGSLADWFDPHSASGILAVVFGFGAAIQALELLTTLASTAPPVAGLVVIFLGFFAYIAWATVHNEELGDDETDTEESTRDRDALAVLKERYARGELSETEFERRVKLLLDVDELAGDDRERELETA